MYMLDLTYEQKVAVVLSCCGLLGIVVVLTACFVCPPCWIHRKLSKRERLVAQNPHYYVKNSFELNFLESEGPPPYEATRRTSLTEVSTDAAFNRRLVCVPNTSNAFCSEHNPMSSIPLPMLTETDVPFNAEMDDGNRGLVALSLQFKKIKGSSKVYPQLRVDLIEANDLPIRLRGGRPNPYFMVALYDTRAFVKSKKDKDNHLPLFEFNSAVVRKTQNPIYHETFFFPMENRQLKKCVLKVEAWDQDKLTNDTCLGTVFYYLKDMERVLMEEPPREVDITLKLEEAKFNYGKILLGLCYLPTSERLTVAVLRADNLMRGKTTDVAHGTEGFFVEGLTMYNGKINEDRRTQILPASNLPFFNEMIMFDVPATKFQQICLVVAIYSTVDNGYGSTGEKKNTCIGKCVLGAKSRKKAAQQWANIQNQPRRQIIEWHELK